MNLAAKLLIVQPKSLCRCLRACRRLNTVFLLREGFDCVVRVGPLRFSFGFPIRKQPDDKIERFQFQLGRIF